MNRIWQRKKKHENPEELLVAGVALACNYSPNHCWWDMSRASV
jgi:hypothetical protein